jgi:hypothetical protein
VDVSVKGPGKAGSRPTLVPRGVEAKADLRWIRTSAVADCLSMASG